MTARHHEHQPMWRPVHDLGRSWNLRNRIENNPPQTVAEALAEIRESGDFDGYFGHGVYDELVYEAAVELFPECFRPVHQTAQADKTVPGVNQSHDFYAAHRSADGRVDWNEVARHTTYAVSVTPLPPQLLPEVVTLTEVDSTRKVG